VVDHQRSCHSRRSQTKRADNVADVLAIDEALERLADIDPDQCADCGDAVFFAGLTVDETSARARALATLGEKNGRWQLARAWLFRELRQEQ
jgi:hypothetical protein